MSVPFSSFNHCLRIIGLRSIGIFARAYLTGRPREVSVFVDGLKHPVMLRVGTTDVGTFKQIFVKQEYGWDLARQPKCIIDAGANIGLTSVYFANRYPTAQIYSIEPETTNFELLSRNVKPYPNVTPIQAALWNENTMINLVDPGLGEWGFQTAIGDQDSPITRRHEVQAITLEHLIASHRIDGIDLLKIDIEGAEVEVFQAADRWIDTVGTLMVELHERFKPGCQAAFRKATERFDVQEQRGPIVLASRKYKLEAQASGV